MHQNALRWCEGELLFSFDMGRTSAAPSRFCDSGRDRGLDPLGERDSQEERRERRRARDRFLEPLDKEREVVLDLVGISESQLFPSAGADLESREI